TYRGLPDPLAVGRVEIHEEHVARREVELVAGQRHRARDAPGGRRELTGEVAAVLPDQDTGGVVEGRHIVTLVVEGPDCVGDDGGRLLTPVDHRPGPGELEVPHVVPVDLVERAVAP